ELADHITHGARGFLVLGRSRKTQLAHRIDDAPLHRLEAIAQHRQRAVEDHVHRIVEVRLLGEGAQRLAFDAFEVQFGVLHREDWTWETGSGGGEATAAPWTRSMSPSVTAHPLCARDKDLRF